jgi:hypothetical protein
LASGTTTTTTSTTSTTSTSTAAYCGNVVKRAVSTN